MQETSRPKFSLPKPHESKTGLRLGANDSMGAGHGSHSSPKPAGFQRLLGYFAGAPLSAFAFRRPVTKQYISVRNLV
jgi:hypothetical protein